MTEETKRGPGRPKKAVEIETPPAQGLVRMVVLRDFWPTDNDEDRVRAGAIVDVTPDEAMDALEIGTMERFKG